MGQTVELTKDELDNYGVIISHSIPDTYHDVQIKINEIVDNGVKYIHRNLIEPLQATKGFNIAKLKSRETSTKIKGKHHDASLFLCLLSMIV